MAVRYVVAARESVGGDGLSRGQAHLPTHGRVAVVHAPLGASITVHSVLDTIAIAGRVSAGGRQIRLRVIVESDNQVAQRLVTAELVDIPPSADLVGVTETIAEDAAGSGNIARE